MIIGLIIAYVLIAYAVGFYIFINGSYGHAAWIAWVLSPIIVVPALLLLLIAG